MGSRRRTRVMASWPCSAVYNAVDAAVGARQQQARRVVVDGSRLAPRIGISTGEASQDQDDWFGKCGDGTYRSRRVGVGHLLVARAAFAEWL